MALFILFGVLWAFCRAVCEVLHSGFDSTRFKVWGCNPIFWDPLISWVNKRRIAARFRLQRQKVKNPFSKAFFWAGAIAVMTCLVFITDAWHLFALLRDITLAASFFFSYPQIQILARLGISLPFGEVFIYPITFVIIALALFLAFFEGFYQFLSTRKGELI
jgi:hypothetical protein